VLIVIGGWMYMGDEEDEVGDEGNGVQGIAEESG